MLRFLLAIAVAVGVVVLLARALSPIPAAEPVPLPSITVVNGCEHGVRVAPDGAVEVTCR